MEKDKNLGKYGQAFQLTTLSLFFKERSFTNRIKDILRPEYFDNKYTKWFCERGLEYLEKYNAFSSETKIFSDLRTVIENEVPSAAKKIYEVTLESIEKADSRCLRVPPGRCAAG